jgi:hypothetical protein
VQLDALHLLLGQHAGKDADVGQVPLDLAALHQGLECSPRHRQFRYGVLLELREARVRIR